MRSLALLVLAAACGGPAAPKPAPTTVTRSQTALPPGTLAAVTTPEAPPAGATPTPAAICDRLMALQKEQCGGVFGVKLKTSRDECVSMFEEKTADRVAQEQRDKFGGCFMEAECDKVMTCLGSLSEPAQNDFRECNDTDHMGPVAITPAEYATKSGSTFKFFDQAASTKDLPIERCGIDNENEWLGTLSCRDGSHPLADGKAELARLGNVGEGGRCHAIIDHYAVKCAEATTDIYIDAYVCPKP
ncbi:MAG TPA: hypothetical protein VGM88_04995 [Kofleriaceae bacterium]|jgi:hypothetical protein